jgi:L-ascorbate metabolism protein UlaG (beta-lactamase superfamily)
MFPPERRDHPGRLIALTRLDDILLLETAADKEPVQKFFRSRIERTLNEIRETRIKEGMQIWQLYNAGFFVRTASVSFVFDAVPGVEGKAFTLGPQLLGRLADLADAAFISHRHFDHANQEVARVFLARNKPVITPDDLWADSPELAGKLTRPARNAEIVHEIPVQQGKQVLKVVAFPGFQGTRITNNVHLVTTPEGLSVIHSGDRSGPNDWQWIADVGYKYRVDVHLGRCWTNQLPSGGEVIPAAIHREARGYDPQIMILGHANEIGHRSIGRVGYTQIYHQMYGSRYPYLVMAWGESYHYRRTAWPRRRLEPLPESAM